MSAPARLHSNTCKFETTYGSLFFHVETDMPCRVLGVALATPQKLENTELYKFIEQLKFEAEDAA